MLPLTLHIKGWPPLLRLGLATRGESSLTAEDVEMAYTCGIRLFNWSGHPDGMSDFIASNRSLRPELFLATQLYARTRKEAAAELKQKLSLLKTETLNLITYYYLETEEEWETLQGESGAHPFLQKLKKDWGLKIGATTHQLSLASSWLKRGSLDCLMLRYNAAHRRIEEKIFPLALNKEFPLLLYTATRWGTLLRSTPEDPPEVTLPRACDCYRFALEAPPPSILLMAPKNRTELKEDLALLSSPRPLTPSERQRLFQHAARVRRASAFP